MAMPIISTLTVPYPRAESAARAQFILFDSGSDMAAWALENGTYREENAVGGWSDVSGKQACEYALNGNLDAARESDEMLSRFEAFAPMRASWEVIDSVIGASPNIPHYIASNPMNMRLRHRTVRETAPLAVIVDSTSSGGIDASMINKRGSAILAFVRALSARRPVELWVFAGQSGLAGEPYGKSATFTGHRVETSPMDLSHAAPCIASAAWSREVGYKICTHHGSGGAWPFSKSSPLTQDEMERVMAVALPHISETLCIPGIFLNDELITDPAKWIERNLARYSGQES